MEVSIKWRRGRIGRVEGRALVDGEMVAEGEFTFAVADDLPEES
jgi:3-hydroxymyristoyl/3-hydroxydecanoyl-(acyl carrier protein) dehydratase